MILEMLRKIVQPGSAIIFAVTAIAITVVKTSPQWMKEKRKRAETSPATTPPRYAQQTSSPSDRITFRNLAILNVLCALSGLFTLIAWMRVPRSLTAGDVVFGASVVVLLWTNILCTVWMTALWRSNK